MAVAARRRRPGTLELLLERARRHSVEFDPYLANHLPMVLVILDRLGAPPARLKAWLERYEAANHLDPAPADQGRIDRFTVPRRLGDRSFEGDYRGFFARDIERRGIDASLRRWLPELVPGIAASALHALMRLAYGRLRDDPAEIGVALGYWSATYLKLGRSSAVAPVTDEPAELLAMVRDVPALSRLEPESDLLWHWMRAAADAPGFPPVAALLGEPPDLLARMARASLALMAGTMSFEALHAVTATHWVRMVGTAWPDMSDALRHLWQAVACVYPKMGMPGLPTAAQLDDLRRRPCPAWPDIAARAVASDDEHDISFTFTAREEERHWGEPLYRVLAARRLGMIG